MAEQVSVPDHLKRYLGPGHGLMRLSSATWVNSTTLVAVSGSAALVWFPFSLILRQLSSKADQLCTIQDDTMTRQTLPDDSILTAADRLWTCPNSKRCVVQLDKVVVLW
jgi:hypothetical protein